MSRVDRSALPKPGPSAPFRFPRIHRARLCATGLKCAPSRIATCQSLSAVLLVPGGTAADPARACRAWPPLPPICWTKAAAGRSALEISDAIARFGADLDVDVGPDATVLSLTTHHAVHEAGGRAARRDGDAPESRRSPTSSACASCGSSGCGSCAITRPRWPSARWCACSTAITRTVISVSGSEAALAATTADELRAFHRGAFVPAGATLVIAGDARDDELIAAAANAFGDWRDAVGRAARRSRRRTHATAARARSAPRGRPAPRCGTIRTAHRRTSARRATRPTITRSCCST